MATIPNQTQGHTQSHSPANGLQTAADRSEARLPVQHEAGGISSARFSIDPSLNPGPAFRHTVVVRVH